MKKPIRFQRGKSTAGVIEIDKYLKKPQNKYFDKIIYLLKKYDNNLQFCCIDVKIYII